MYTVHVCRRYLRYLPYTYVNCGSRWNFSKGWLRLSQKRTRQGHVHRGACLNLNSTTRMSKLKSKQEEALAFLDDLDSFTPPPLPPATTSLPPPPGAAGEGEAEVLAFIDEITQKSAEPTPRSSQTHREKPTGPGSRSGTPTLRKSTERVRLGAAGQGQSTPSLLPKASSSSLRDAKQASFLDSNNSNPAPTGGSGGGWGWGSVWSSASAAIQQAKSAVDEQVKYLPKNEQARKWGEGVIEYAKSAQLDKIGGFNFTLFLS